MIEIANFAPIHQFSSTVKNPDCDHTLKPMDLIFAALNDLDYVENEMNIEI